MMIPPRIAAMARIAMIQLKPPSRPFFFVTAEVERAPSNAVAAEAATGAAIIEVAARETAALVSRFIVFSPSTGTLLFSNRPENLSHANLRQISRASVRERVCQYV